MPKTSNLGRHAYLIIAHNQFQQLGTLLSVLDDPRNDIFLHIDKKAEYSQKTSDFLKGCLKYSSLAEIPRLSVSWGGFSQIQAELSLFSAAAAGHYDYYHLLSGIDFPLKTQDEIHDFFNAHKGLEFVHFCEEEFQIKFEDRLRYHWYFQDTLGRRHDFAAERIRDLSTRLLNRQKKKGTDRLITGPFPIVRAGSNWVSLTDAFLQYLLTRKQDIEKAFKNTISGDEELVQTVIFNSEFRGKLYFNSQEHPGNVRKIDWTRGNPYVWKNDDYQELMDSGCLFARKIIASEDPELFRRLLQRVSEKEHR